MQDFARAYLMVISPHGAFAVSEPDSAGPAEVEPRDLLLSVRAYRTVSRLLDTVDAVRDWALAAPPPPPPRRDAQST